MCGWFDSDSGHVSYFLPFYKNALFAFHKGFTEEFMLDPVFWHVLRRKSFANLVQFGLDVGLDVSTHTNRSEALLALLFYLDDRKQDMFVEGIVDVQADNFAFLRFASESYLPSADDVYIPFSKVKQWGLRTGDVLFGTIVPPENGEKYPSFYVCHRLNDTPLAQCRRNRVRFDELTPLHPTQKIDFSLKNDPKDCTLRIVDLVAPMGFGQRSLIVAPPRTGKTVILQKIATAIAENHPDVLLIVLLIDERPEEVTDMQRSVRGEVVSSTFDELPTRHIKVAEMTLARAKRMVECGRDVVVLLDSITRLARAYNAVIPSSGKVLTGGVDSNALQKPKRFFGAARNIENGGSLTIIGSALVETGSRLDEVVFEEFKGTGNSELQLNQKCSEERCFPAINIKKSGTRKEELLLPAALLSRIWVLRRILSPMSVSESVEFLVDKMKNTRDNIELFSVMNG